MPAPSSVPQRLQWLLQDGPCEPQHLALATAAWRDLLLNMTTAAKDVDAAEVQARLAAESRVLDNCSRLQPGLDKRLRLSALTDRLRQDAAGSAVRAATFDVDSRVSGAAVVGVGV